MINDPMWVAPGIAAHAAKVKVATIRKWKARGLIRVNAGGLYSLLDVFNWVEQRNSSQVRHNTPVG